MSKICVVVLVGIPGAGKTTFCQKIKYNEKFNVVHVCFDSYIKTQSEDLGSYKNTRKKLIVEIKNLIHAIKNNNMVTDFFFTASNIIENMRNYLILIDDNNYYKGMRYEFYKLCRYTSVAFLQIYFSIQLSEALKRNQKRKNEYIPRNVIEDMNKKLEIPSVKSNWEKSTVVVNGEDNIDLKNILSHVEKCPCIVMNTSEVKTSAKQTKIHEIDVALRRHIKHLVTNQDKAKEQNVQIMAKTLNLKRKHLLKDIRSGIFDLDDDKFDFMNILMYELKNCTQ